MKTKSGVNMTQLKQTTKRMFEPIMLDFNLELFTRIKEWKKK